MTLIISLAAFLLCNLFFLDVEQAQAPLQRAVYARPNRFILQMFGQKDDVVLAIKKTMYGLKDSARAWWEHMDMCLQKIGFIPTSLDPCLYVFIKDAE